MRGPRNQEGSETVPKVIYEKKGEVAYVTLNRPEAVSSWLQRVYDKTDAGRVGKHPTAL